MWVRIPPRTLYRHMATFPLIAVKPELLRWARESIGVKLEEAAHALGLTSADVEEWETKSSSIRLTQLEKLSELYKRPLAAFLLPQPPKEPALPQDFRRFQDSEALSPASRLAIRRARRLRTVAIELAESLDQKIDLRLPRISDTHDPEHAAAVGRKGLGIDIDSQLSWRDSRVAFARWRAAIENTGVLVFQLPLPIKELRGFSLSEKEYPVTAVSSKDSLNGRIFSLLHEYAHVLLRSGGLCDMRDESVLPGGLQIEHFCNWFAGAFLVPREHFLGHVLVNGIKRDRRLDADALLKLANTYKVSQDVVLRRLLTVDVISQEVYKAQAKELEEAFRAIPKKKTKGGPPPAARAVQEAGVPLSAMVLSAYRKEAISSKEVSDFLGVRQKHVATVEKLLAVKAP